MRRRRCVSTTRIVGRPREALRNRRRNGAGQLWRTTGVVTVRIVDPDPDRESGRQGGRDLGARRQRRERLLANPQQSEGTFGAELVDPSPGTPQGPWLRTGDLGVMSQGELFIIGRIKDLLIVDGRNHYPDDIEATIQEITGGRVAAISIPMIAPSGWSRSRSSRSGALRRSAAPASHRETRSHLGDQEVAQRAGGGSGAGAPGSIPITTSGKVRRSACVERYRQDEFSRLDVTA